MKKSISMMSCLIAAASLIIIAGAPQRAETYTYTVPGMTVGVGAQGILSGPYDLTTGEFVVKATLNLNALNDTYHTIFKLGVHDTGTSENLMLGAGHGVWLATDHQWWKPGDFTPEPSVQDLDDKLILARQSDWPNDETAYNLPGVPPNAYDNHNIWFDRDGPASSTGGIYNIELHLLATSNTTGTAYLMVNGLWQGFETDVPKDWSDMEMTPAGMTFTGDMTKMQVFYGVKGWAYDGDKNYTNPVNTSTVTVVGPPVPIPAAFWLLGSGLVGLIGIRRRLRK